MKMKSLLMFLLSSVGVFILGVVLFNYVFMPLFIHKYETVMVPDVVGLSKKQASEVLKKRSLAMKVERSEFNNEIPKSYIISQSPRPGEKVKEGRAVRIVLSLGARMQRVPDLAGLSLRQSRILLRRNNLRTRRIAKMLLTGSNGEFVITSTPQAGKELEEGSAVDILVAAGGLKRRYLMPDLAGQDLLFIREKLEKMGFRISNVMYEYRRGVYPNTIINQSPKSGAQIREGDSIELVAATTD